MGVLVPRTFVSPTVAGLSLKKMKKKKEKKKKKWKRKVENLTSTTPPPRRPEAAPRRRGLVYFTGVALSSASANIRFGSRCAAPLGAPRPRTASATSTTLVVE